MPHAIFSVETELFSLMDQHNSNSTHQTIIHDLTLSNAMIFNGIIINLEKNMNCTPSEDVESVESTNFPKCDVQNGRSCNSEVHDFPDPRHYNLSADFIYIENEWGSMFYKHIGKMNRTEAKRRCSMEGDSVHLPIPRFPDENEFYRVYFGDSYQNIGNQTGLWLGVSDFEEEGLFRSDTGYQLIKVLPQYQGFKMVKKHGWINASFTVDPNSNDVKMSSTGLWETATDRKQSPLLTSICVYNILPEKCSKCYEEDFCRYTSGNRKEIECICPDMREGEFCEINSCSQCLNDGQCHLNEHTEEIECICQYPFHGKYCELGLVYQNFDHE